MRDVRWVRAALPVLRKHHFTAPDVHWVWTVIQDTYKAARELPTVPTYISRVTRDFKTTEERDLILLMLRKLHGRPVSGPRQAIEEIRKFARFAALRALGGNLLLEVDEGDAEGAEKTLFRALTEIRQVSGLEQPLSFYDEYQDLKDLISQGFGKPLFPTPLEGINRLIGGGLRAGVLAEAVAVTNVGKTAFATACGNIGLQTPRTVVVHATTEETRTEARVRYAAAIGELDRFHLLTGDGDVETRFAQVNAAVRRREDELRRLFVVELPPGESVEKLRTAVYYVRESFPDDPILLVIDSPDHLQPTHKAENARLATGAVYWTVKGMTLDPTLEPLSAWATVQAKQEYRGKKLKAEAVSDNYDKARVTDFMLGLQETGEPVALPDWKRIEYSILKNRISPHKHVGGVVNAQLGGSIFQTGPAFRLGNGGSDV